MSQTEEIIESIEEQTPDDTPELADDLDRTIKVLAGQLDLSRDDHGLGISPQQGLAVLRPMIRAKTADSPESALKTLARIHLESGALLDKHSNVEPEDLIG